MRKERAKGDEGGKRQAVFRVMNVRVRILDYVPRTREALKGSKLGNDI